VEPTELNQILIKILPIVFTFILGFLLKKGRVFTSESADTMLKLVFYVSLPALILLAMIHTTLNLSLIYLPVICIVTVIATLLIVLTTGRSLHLSGQTLGAFVVGPMIMNTTFTIPFLLTAYGQEAIARLSILDVGNNIVIYSLVYFFAYRYGSEGGPGRMLKTIAQSPILYALFLGIALNAAHVKPPAIYDNFLLGIGAMTTPLVMISLGIYFNHAVVRIRATFISVAIRIMAGFLIAFSLVYLFRLDGLNRVVVLVACSAPIGFTTLTFSAIAGLDTEFAASCVSYSILIGLFTTPLLIFFLS
jgi:malate permease and related proteins